MPPPAMSKGGGAGLGALLVLAPMALLGNMNSKTTTDRAEVDHPVSAVVNPKVDCPAFSYGLTI